MTKFCFSGDNQRMELLGDSIVQCLVTDYLYRHFPQHHEGHLTLLRSSLVNRNIQAQIATEVGLDRYIHFGNGPVSIQAIIHYILALH